MSVISALVHLLIGCSGNECDSQCYVPRFNSKGEYVKGKNAAGSGMVATRKSSMWLANVRSDGFVECAESACNGKNNRGVLLTYGTAQIAHIIADANGGSFCRLNLVLTCKRCNDKRGDKDMVQGDVRSTWDTPDPIGERDGKRNHLALK